MVPPGAVYIGRPVPRVRLARSKWANPFKIGPRRHARRSHRPLSWLLRRPELMAALREIRGKDLAYWCAPERCHGEVVLELANA